MQVDKKVEINPTFKEIGKVYFCNEKKYVGDYFSIPVMDYRVIKEEINLWLVDGDYDKHMTDFIYHLDIRANQILSADGKKHFNIKLYVYFNNNMKWGFELTNIQIYGKGLMLNAPRKETTQKQTPDGIDKTKHIN